MKLLEFQLSPNQLNTISMSHIVNDFEKGYYNSFLICIEKYAMIDDEQKADYLQKAHYITSGNKPFTTRIFKKFDKKNILELVYFTFVMD